MAKTEVPDPQSINRLYELRSEYVDELKNIPSCDKDYQLITQAKIVALSQALGVLGYHDDYEPLISDFSPDQNH